MYGNVMEFCLDAYASEADLKAYYAELYGEGNPILNPTGPATLNATKPRYHAVRGGAWFNSDRSYFHNYYRKYNYSDKYSGLRFNGGGARFVVSP